MKNKKTGVCIVTLLMILVLVLILVFTGCSSQNLTTEPTSAASDTSAKTAVYTDMLDRKVTLTTNVKRIVLVRTMDIYMLRHFRQRFGYKIGGSRTKFPRQRIDGYKSFLKYTKTWIK